MSEGGRIEPGPGWRRPVMSTEDRLGLIRSLNRAEHDGAKIQIGIGPMTLFKLIAALQLAWRHSHMSGRQAASLELLGRELSDGFPADSVRQVLEDGWVR